MRESEETTPKPLKHYEDKQEFLSSYGDLLNVEDLSAIFKVSKNTIYKSVQNGDFGTPIHIGREYRIPKIYIIEKFILNYK